MRKLVFAFAPPADRWPSALLRGRQLMQLIHAANHAVSCQASPLAALTRTRGERIVLTKSALYAITAETLGQLRAQGHVLIADFVDLPVDHDIAAGMDFLLASSRSQAEFFRQQLPQIPVFHITHHVDLRLPKIIPAAGPARFGYFGKPQNCMYESELGGLVSVVAVENPAQTGWMQRLAALNAHYALRTRLGAGVFKPFTKGFIAAHCSAPVIVAAADTEARHYLGADYPFSIADLSLGAVRAHLEEFAVAYGTAPWRAAIAMMREVAERSGQAQIKHELMAFLAALPTA
jgi:hypothetical protein